MFVGDRDAVLPVTGIESGPADQPAGGDFHTVPRRPVRRGVVDAFPQYLEFVGGDDRIDEERACTVGVGVVWIENHSLAAAQTEHGLTSQIQRDGVTDRRPERLSGFGVPDRLGTC